MKEIKIFLASSEELEIDRHRFGNYIRKIDEVYEKRGVRVRLIEWEDLDSSYQGRRTQDMYNDKLCDCQMCVALFHTKAGKYTLEEVNVARERFEESGFPKVYVYVKDLAQGEVSTPELEEFKSRLFESLGHYFCRYGNTDTLILQFIMQLQLVDTSYKPKIDTEDSAIRIEGRPMVSLENVPFAANNDTYCELHEEIAELQEEISEIEEELLNAPNPKKEEKLGRKRTKLFNLKEKRASLEKDLVNTAMTIARLLGKSTSERLRKAIALFESGDNKGADALLDMSDIEREAELNAGLVQAGKEAYQAAVSNIEELRLKAKNVLTIHDNQSRFDEADHAYSIALETAHKIELPTKDLISLLSDYHKFLIDNARYANIQSISDEWLRLAIEEFGETHEETANAFNSIGKNYRSLGDFTKAMEFFNKALILRESILGKNHPDTAKSYNNLGGIFSDLGIYDKSLDFHKKALEIRETICGKDHADTAQSYNNLGVTYYFMRKFGKALKSHTKALEIRERILGISHPDTAISYNNIGGVLSDLHDYDKSLYFHKKALEIRRKILGEDHPDTAQSYNNIGVVYYRKGEFTKALDFYNKALQIRDRILGRNHPDTATSLKNLGDTYTNLGKYDKAFDFYNKALVIQKAVLGIDHPDTVISSQAVSDTKELLRLFNESQAYYNESLEIRTRIQNSTHSGMSICLGAICRLPSLDIFGESDDYSRALELNQKAIDIAEAMKGSHPELAKYYFNQGTIYYNLKNYRQALRWDIKYNMLCPKDIEAILRIAESYQHLGDYKESLEWYKKGLEIEPENLICLDKVNELLAKVTGLGDKKS